MQRRRIMHTTTFEERLAEEARRFKEAAEKRPQVAWPASCFYAALGKPKPART
jgi:hypothetical protein